MKRRGVLSNKKGLSEIIGYVLLISITMILSVIVYQWVKTYVPKDAIECDDGVSIFVNNYNYSCENKNLNLTVKNSGRFDIAGYFIHATTSETQELAVTDLSETTPNGDGGAVNYWLKGGGNDLNPISAGNSITDVFDLTGIDSSIYSIQLVPLRYEEVDGRNRPVSCTNAKITQKLSCTSGVSSCVDNGIQEGVEECDCDEGVACTSEQLNGYECSTLPGQGFNGGTLSCNVGCTFDTSLCTAPACGDNALDVGEQCDDGNTNSGDGCSNVCQVEILTIGYFGFESGAQGWTVSGNSNRESSNPTPVSQFTDVGQSGGSWNIRIRGGGQTSAEISRNFNLTGFRQVNISWSGYYNSFEGNDCLSFRIDGVQNKSWGTGSTCASISQGSWSSQKLTLTNNSHTFDNSVLFSFRSGMSNQQDFFYIDGINITGVKF